MLKITMSSRLYTTQYFKTFFTNFNKIGKELPYNKFKEQIIQNPIDSLKVIHETVSRKHDEAKPYKKWNIYKHRFYSDDKVINGEIDIWLIQWDFTHSTLPHDHAPGGCIQHILEGNLAEIRYDKEMNYLYTHQLSGGDTSFITNDMGFHTINNPFMKTAYSMHYYLFPNNHK